MRLRFNGMFARKSSTGCGCGGGTSTSRKAYITHKTLVLPSGRMISVSLNEEYEVNEVDGNFLLSYTQIDKDGLMQNAFTKVD